MRTFAVTVLVLASGVGAGEKPLTHPHFNDGGAIPWYTELAAASAAAKKQGKLVLIEYGREA
ncbi:MAG TPA: hypothetical protein VFY93_13770 [Planctomycetota bacterium]|nr:hypothetical protein [Planctomycetota bacterium]